MPSFLTISMHVSRATTRAELLERLNLESLNIGTQPSTIAGRILDAMRNLRATGQNPRTDLSEGQARLLRRVEKNVSSFDTLFSPRLASGPVALEISARGFCPVALMEASVPFGVEEVADKIHLSETTLRHKTEYREAMNAMLNWD